MATSSKKRKREEKGDKLTKGSRSNVANDDDPRWDPTHPLNLIPELCHGFYNLKWMHGTGGALSIRQSDGVYVTPSAVQKERIKPCDLYVLDEDGQIKHQPTTAEGTLSSCTPIFLKIFKELPTVTAVIHTHSIYSMLVTLLFEKEFRISDQEMIKGIVKGTGTGKYYANTDVLVVPIVDNRPSERELVAPIAEAMAAYPLATAVLVRRHGVFVWGDTWASAKTQAECYEYLFEAAVRMRQLGLQTVST